MKDIDWRSIDRRELAGLLKDAAQVSSQAVGEATVYRLGHGPREMLAIALPGGAVIVVEKTARQVRKRRQVDGDRVSTPASR